jgi:hypothetical protein
MARRAARTRIERGHHWTQVLTPEERSERSRAEWLVGVGKRTAESASCEQWHSTRGHWVPLLRR